jgi:hypothetical protein
VTQLRPPFGKDGPDEERTGVTSIGRQNDAPRALVMSNSDTNWTFLSKKPIRIFAFPLVLVVVTVVLSILGISGTSIGVLEGDPATNPHLPHVIAGTPRVIRSDEWNVITPIVVEQSRSGFSSQLQVGLGQHNLNVIGDVPTRNWSALFRPWDLPSLVLGSSQGFASRWWLLSLVLIFGSYALILELTGRIDLSIYFSLGIWLSPFFQWWYASGALATVGMAFLTAFFILRAFKSTRIRLVTYSLMAAWAASSFIMVLYPPFQIPVALILALIIFGQIGFLLQSRSLQWKPISVAIAIITITTFMIIAFWFAGNKGTISAINGTAYPGHRPADGGDAVLANVLSAPFGLQLALRGAVGLVTTNQSEISSFLILGPFAAIQLFFLQRSQLDLRSRWIVGALGVAFFIFVAWMFLGLPSPLAHLLLLDKAPPGRVVIGLGITGFLMMAVLCGSVLKTHVRPPKHTKSSLVSISQYRLEIGGVIVGLLAFLMYAWAGKVIRIANPQLGLSTFKILVFSGLAGVTIGLLAACRTSAGGIALLAFSALAGIFVNPLYHGLEPLSQSPIIQSFRNISLKQTDPSKQTWVALAGTPVTDLLTASGLPTANAVQLFPDQNFWMSFIPGGVDKFTWNRYANLVFFAGSPGSPNRVSLVKTDQISVTFDPCGPGAQQLKIGFFVSPTPLSARCLTLQNQQHYRGTTVFVYSKT